MNKSSLRKEIKQRLLQLTDEEIANKSSIIVDKLINLQEVKEAKMILSYLPFGKEVNIDVFNNFIKDKVCYPKCYQDSMMAYKMDGTFTISKYGIREPLEIEENIVNKEDIELVIMPCVGYDDYFNRLGHGKGYYDKYLAGTKLKTVLVGYKLQQLENIPVNEFDVKTNIIVNEEEILKSE